jgi:hypothetical protein
MKPMKKKKSVTGRSQSSEVVVTIRGERMEEITEAGSG